MTRLQRSLGLADSAHRYDARPHHLGKFGPAVDDRSWIGFDRDIVDANCAA